MKWSFKFINLDKVEHFSQKDKPEYDEIIMTGEKLVSLLRKPLWVDFEISPVHYHAAKQKSPECRLISVPTELLDKVFKNLRDSGDCDALVCLAVTNSYFFRVLAKDLQKILRGDAGKWSGDRIIFAGSLAAGIPSGVGTPEDEAEWWAKKHHTLADIDTKEIIPAGGMDKSPLMPMDATEIFNAPGHVITRAKATMDKKLDLADLELLNRLLNLLMEEPNLTDEQKKPVLRNLITKSFILGEGAFGNLGRQASLGEALLPFIWFVGDRAWAPLRESWTAHKYDISPAVTVEGPEWLDITRGATKSIMYFYLSRILWRTSLDQFTIVNLPTRFSLRMQALDDAREARAAIDNAVNDAATDDTAVDDGTMVNYLAVFNNGSAFNDDGVDDDGADDDDFDDAEFMDFSEDEDDDGDILLIEQN